jgi:hypothetical protein
MSSPQPARTRSAPGNSSSLRIRIDPDGGRVHMAGQLDRRTVHLLHDAISTLLLAD